MTRRCENFVTLGVAWVALSLAALSDAVLASEVNELRVLGADYPRAFFFRAAEGQAASGHYTYEAWDHDFSRLMGLMGKVLEEELPGRSVNVEFFTRFKQAHPEQLVMLHCNGNARDPRWESQRFFAGHWLYHNGAKILDAVPAQAGETIIHVSDASLFRTEMGLNGNSNEDIGLCALDEQGRPDWRQSEQVELVAVDIKKKTLRVRRGAFGTTPQAFAAGKSYAAAHVTEGPWGAKSHLLWAYNYALCCPLDAQGRTCTDVWVAHLGELFGPGGKLATFDGLEFDVLFNFPEGIRRRRGPDCDADGQADAGFVGRTNVYGLGVVEFCRKLRTQLGEKKLILADGALGRDSDRSQRAFGLLNGIESEGWPNLRDTKLTDWSGGLNRFAFWNQNARPPVFSYTNHKFMELAGGKEKKQAEVPFNIHRLVFAAALFSDAAICYSSVPPSEARKQIGIWDELWMGTAKRTGWLGKPLGPPVRMASRAVKAMDLRSQLRSAEAEVVADGDAVKISARDPAAQQMHIELRDVPCAGPDLYIELTARAATQDGLVRLAKLGGFMTHFNERDFTAGFYFNTVGGTKTNLELSIEGSAPLWITSIKAYAHPDAIYREFEHGVVLANPALHAYRFALTQLFPGASFRRLQASPHQDTRVNNGEKVGTEVLLGPQDALFLSRDTP